MIQKASIIRKIYSLYRHLFFAFIINEKHFSFYSLSTFPHDES